MGAFWAVIIRLHAFVGPVLSLMYPIFASVKAIESPSKEDDEQWLTYWILYSFITLFEMVAAPALAWFPLWYPLKLAFISWLALPQFKGASFIYDQFVRKYVIKNKGNIQNKVNEVLSPETRSSVEQFINDHGQEAFDKWLAGVPKDVGKTTRPSPTQESQERY